MVEKKAEIKIKKQDKFPFLHKFATRFPVNNDTVFVFKDTIYTNNELSYDIALHERKHLERQAEIGAENWINLYLESEEFRLQEELIAYKYQLSEVKRLTNNDREEMTNIRNECIRVITSKLYGNMISYQDACKELTKI